MSKKLNVILDTDIYNECDDQFALSYLLKSQDIFQVDAVTIAPFSHKNSFSVAEGTQKSYEEAVKICNWLHFDTHKVLKGSTDFIQNGYKSDNDAVNKIIEVAHQNDKTYILAIGAITNVALAIQKDSSIVNKVEVIWLGSNGLLIHDNRDYNFRQDVDAARIVFESKVPLTVIPCKNVSSNLRTSIYEVEHFLKGKGKLCDYLCQRFHDDGFHGVQERRVIWDISTVAYLINKDWFDTIEISCPLICEDTSFEMTKGRHKVTFVNYLDVDKIYEDLFEKLGADNEN